MKTDRLIAFFFTVSMLASFGLIAVYVFEGDAQLEGTFLGVALSGLGIGFVLWAATLHTEPVTEEREHPDDVEGGDVELDAEPLTRRAMLWKLLAGAGGALAAALAIPALSLGPRPGESLFKTAWTPGARLVDTDGNPLKVTDIAPGTVQTVFPEGQVDAADAQTLILRVDPNLLELPSDRVAWAPEGVVGYSKICTHAGCPVGLYRAESHELLCPCHQSTFDVLRGAEPTFGPADRPLPQLPIEIDSEGYLVATGDFSEPVGPGFWNLDSDG
ncbi:MAG: ubiquinol-cytochrome c reductase iron-sulfur subunit [Actinomycetota bacterium]|jgi:ubiquinol-cytochrome c reductase iron-sulfur subunit|nr:ubiquinol-cytochrome c reductase iron-sulfur subunit [Actinomycetota bacterium]